jgi:hypothetical protein
MAESGITLDELISLENQSTLQLVSNESLYSYVFKITDTRTGKVYAIKLIPMGYLPKTDLESEQLGSQQSQEVESSSGLQKKTTPNQRRIEKEMEYAKKFEGIGPHTESHAIYPNYTTIIVKLIAVAQDEETKDTLNELQKLLTKLDENGFQGVGLACIVMEFIPGQTLWEVQQKLGSTRQAASEELLIVTMGQIIDLLFTRASVLFDCHKKNIQVSQVAACKASAESSRNPFQKFKVTILDFGDAYPRTSITDTEEEKRAFIYKVKKRVAYALWLQYDGEEWKNADEFMEEIPHHAVQLMENLIGNDEFISLSEIQDINDLRVVLAIIRETSDQYSWMGGLINNDTFLNTLLIYLKEKAARQEAARQERSRILKEQGKSRILKEQGKSIKLEINRREEEEGGSGGKRKSKSKTKRKSKSKTKRKSKSKTKRKSKSKTKRRHK